MAKRQETIGAGLQRKAPTIRRWSRNRRRWTGTRLLLLDFLLAWALGIVFQYFTIAPMRGLSFGKGVLQAMRADTLSIVGFQIGMSAWAALVHFVLFTNPHLQVNEAVFWFMMQIGMMIGFISSYPVNLLLIKAGWKERMPQ